MAKFRKKPVVIDAEQYRPGLEDGFMPHPMRHAAVNPGSLPDVPYIATLEGNHIVTPGDWIITGIAGERYPCRDNIFRATYQPVDDTGAACPSPGAAYPGAGPGAPKE